MRLRKKFEQNLSYQPRKPAEEENLLDKGLSGLGSTYYLPVLALGTLLVSYSLGILGWLVLVYSFCEHGI